ncbi:Carbohydrate-selective porin OprB [Gloeothece citriformis PCC 7424]|uniref:Carbohydrate-selective porin OprB n=1 Tax=Gloeothece citriformis (strain PCC 7424) TaxID=65393 RepID=B7KGR4_GLOC7|nr:iron uptake porin [Gloeothece citriformis]ACK71991.1 Carbohydrate-selective porin OprB [Gloeothece citriformis PCC 7424]
MSRKWWNLIKTTPLLVGASVLTAQGAVANPEVPETQVNSFSLPSNEQLLAQAVPGTPGSPAPEATEILQMMQRSREGKRINTQVYDKPMSQVNNVNQLRDVEPTAWAYEALRSLVERYGCIVGYPDRTFRGDRALTRWEFAAGLNACLNVLERLIQEGVAVVREDLETLKRLADEFAAELAALGARIDNLESRVAFLEDHQFSTTTKLNGEVIFAYANAFSDDYAFDSTFEDRSLRQQDALERGRRVGREGVFVDRVRLNFDASFSGKDRLRVRVESNNTPNFTSATGSAMSRLGFDSGTDNDTFVTDLYYRFSPFRNFTAWVGTTNMGLEDVFNPGNPYLEPSGTGALSRFVRRNPLVFRGPDGNGVGARYKFSDFISVTALYLADENDARSPLPGQGVFNGDFSAGVQAVITPFDRFNINLTYLHSYFSEGSVNLSGSTGSRITQDPSTAFLGLGTIPSAWNRDSVGAQIDWQALDWLHFTLWGGYAYAEAKNPNYDSNGDIWTWNAIVNFVDILKEGAVLSFSGGMPPRITGVNNGPDDEDTSIIVEAQYQYPISDNILITPGFYVILDPNHFERNDDIWVGVLRTTFKF